MKSLALCVLHNYTSTLNSFFIEKWSVCSEITLLSTQIPLEPFFNFLPTARSPHRVQPHRPFGSRYMSRFSLGKHLAKSTYQKLKVFNSKAKRAPARFMCEEPWGRWSMFENLMVPKIDILGRSLALYLFFFAQLNTYWFICFARWSERGREKAETFIRRTALPRNHPTLSNASIFLPKDLPGRHFHSDCYMLR